MVVTVAVKFGATCTTDIDHVSQYQYRMACWYYSYIYLGQLYA